MFISYVTDFLKTWYGPYVAVSVPIAGALLAKRIVRHRQRRRSWSNVGKDVVVLHNFPRGNFCPNLSPFAFKLETYLRMAKIPYVLDFEVPMGPKGKCPWITFNGGDIGDSQLIIEHLGHHFQNDFSANLNNKEKAVANAIQVMVDEHLIWGLGLWRMVYDSGKQLSIAFDFPWFSFVFLHILKSGFLKRVKSQGLGRHRRSEVEEIVRKDLEALSHYLGSKKFMMGNDPTEVDCSVFGMVAQLIWSDVTSPYTPLIQNHYSNLVLYCNRMREVFWSDWEQSLHPNPKMQWQPQ